MSRAARSPLLIDGGSPIPSASASNPFLHAPCSATSSISPQPPSLAVVGGNSQLSLHRIAMGAPSCSQQRTIGYCKLQRSASEAQQNNAPSPYNSATTVRSGAFLAPEILTRGRRRSATSRRTSKYYNSKRQKRNKRIEIQENIKSTKMIYFKYQLF